MNKHAFGSVMECFFKVSDYIIFVSVMIVTASDYAPFVKWIVSCWYRVV